MWAAAFIYDVAAVKKIHGVPPPRFNLVFQVSGLFHHEWSRFHHEWPRFKIDLKCFKPTSFLESPHLVLISFCRRNQHFHKPCLTSHLVFIIVNKCSCSYGPQMATGSYNISWKSSNKTHWDHQESQIRFDSMFKWSQLNHPSDSNLFEDHNPAVRLCFFPSTNSPIVPGKGH